MIQNKSCNGYYEHDRTCYWFELVNGSSSKIIPDDTFNKGCKQYKNTAIGNQTIDGITTKIIKVEHMLQSFYQVKKNKIL